MNSELSPIMAVIFAILGGLLFYFKGKADKAGSEALLGEVKGEDKSLVKQQSENQAKLDQVNKDIQDLKDEKKKLRDLYLTDQQRADKWNK